MNAVTLKAGYPFGAAFNGGVDLAAMAFDFEAEITGAAPAGALEGHVLDEVGESAATGGVVAGARPVAPSSADPGAASVAADSESRAATSMTS